jgi:iron-sulfur cluster repair protein YtfE (RIC family)
VTPPDALPPPAAARRTARATTFSSSRTFPGQLEEELMVHIHLENNVLFRRALVE